MIWDIFKSKKQKEQIKQKTLVEELEEFKTKYSKYFNSYAFDGKHLIIFKTPEIKDGKIILNYITPTTPKGYQNYKELSLLQWRYGENFMEEHRNAFINLKGEFEKLGVQLTKADV